MKIETIETLASAGNRTTGTGAGVMVMGFITSSGFLGVMGMLIGLSGLLINLYFKLKSDRRAEHLLRLQAERLLRDSPLRTDECVFPEESDRDRK